MAILFWYEFQHYWERSSGNYVISQSPVSYCCCFLNSHDLFINWLAPLFLLSLSDCHYGNQSPTDLRQVLIITMAVKILFLHVFLVCRHGMASCSTVNIYFDMKKTSKIMFLLTPGIAQTAFLSLLLDRERKKGLVRFESHNCLRLAAMLHHKNSPCALKLCYNRLH